MVVRRLVVPSLSEIEAPQAGPGCFPPPFEEDLGCFIQDVHRVLIIDDLADAVAEGTNDY